MPRRGIITPRVVVHDPKYRDQIVARFINCIMRQGKKGVAETIFYSACDIIEKKVKQDPIQVFRRAIDNCKPALEVRGRRVGGATYQVPVEVRPARRQALAFRWLIQFAEKRSEKTMKERLAAEVMDAANNSGGAIRKKEEVHKLADSNKAFAHYRW